MNNVALGASDARVSSIGFGTWQAGDDTWGPDVNDNDCALALARGAELGVNLVDTAENYGRGHAEEVVGKAIRLAGRGKIFVATKVSEHHLHGEDVVKACLGSMRRLRVDFIDLYQIHWTDPYDQVPLRETMRAMERLQRDGKIGQIGVSNFAVRDLAEARSALSRTDIVSNQVQYNLLHREIEAEVMPYCEREGITILAYSPLARGLLTGKYGPRHRPKDQVRADAVLFRPKNLREVVPLLRKLHEIAMSRNGTPAQVALAWLLSHQGVIPIPGVKRPAQAAELSAASTVQLNPHERKSLDKISSNLRLDTF
jgi:myo-inositol catabolism protein IolS